MDQEGYNVEISINLLKETTSSMIESVVREIAEENECDYIYSYSETDGTSKIPRYHYIIVVNFSKDNLENFVHFIKYIKRYNKVHIECIYNDTTSNLVYGSGYYLKTLGKENAKIYKMLIKNKNFTEEDAYILSNIKKNYKV
jgi:hypothetical protein